MIRLDSIKVKLPIDSIADIKNFNAMNMIHTTQKIQGIEHSSLTQKGYAGFVLVQPKYQRIVFY